MDDKIWLPVNVPLGAAQCSILGPILFLTFTSYLNSYINHCSENSQLILFFSHYRVMKLWWQVMLIHSTDENWTKNDLLILFQVLLPIVYSVVPNQIYKQIKICLHIVTHFCKPSSIRWNFLIYLTPCTFTMIKMRQYDVPAHQIRRNNLGQQFLAVIARPLGIPSMYIRRSTLITIEDLISNLRRVASSSLLRVSGWRLLICDTEKKFQQTTLKICCLQVWHSIYSL